MKEVLRTVAAVSLIPALVILANLVCFAFVGAGFLPEATDQMQLARAFVGWASSCVAVLFWVQSI